MLRSALVSALASALALTATGCSDDMERRSEVVSVKDGGYALVAVLVPAKHDAIIRFAFEGGAKGESFAVFDEPDDPPFHTGWFDMSPWMESCERDPSTSECLDVHTQKAGAFVGVARHQGAAIPEVTAHCECPGKYACTHYYAIVAGERGPDRDLRVIVDTTNVMSADGAKIRQIR